MLSDHVFAWYFMRQCNLLSITGPPAARIQSCCYDDMHLVKNFECWRITSLYICTYWIHIQSSAWLTLRSPQHMFRHIASWSIRMMHRSCSNIIDMSRVVFVVKYRELVWAVVCVYSLNPVHLPIHHCWSQLIVHPEATGCRCLAHYDSQHLELMFTRISLLQTDQAKCRTGFQGCRFDTVW